MSISTTLFNRHLVVISQSQFYINEKSLPLKMLRLLILTWFEVLESIFSMLMSWKTKCPICVAEFISSTVNAMQTTSTQPQFASCLRFLGNERLSVDQTRLDTNGSLAYNVPLTWTRCRTEKKSLLWKWNSQVDDRARCRYRTQIFLDACGKSWDSSTLHLLTSHFLPCAVIFFL